jgi:predicted secreted protein
MTTNAGTLYASMGTTIKMDGTAIAHIHQLKGLDLSASTIDTTALDTSGGYKTFIASTKEAGDVSLQGFFNGSDHSALYNAFQSGSSHAFVIEFPDIITTGTGHGSQWTFNAIVTAFKTDAQVGNAVGFDCTLKVSGQPTLVMAT